jgi:hypothetical protein
MKKTFVAVSAISLFSLASIASASNMASWVAKNKPKPMPAEEIQKAETIQSVESAQPISQPQPDSNPAPQPQTYPAQQQPQLSMPNHAQQPKNQVGMMKPNAQQQVSNEVVRQEATARALEALMPKVVPVINSPSVPVEHKKYAFKYIGQISQMLADPKNFQIGSVLPGYNSAVSCAAIVGGTNTLIAAYNILMQNQILAENFQIAKSRGGFVNFGQQVPGVTCK